MSDKPVSERTEYEKLEYAEPKEQTKMKFNQIYEWMVENDRVPTIKETMEITGLSYWPAGSIRRRALREFPKLDMEEISFSVKELILERIRSKQMDDNNLIKLMPWVAPQIASAVDVKQDITHRFIVVKPGEDKPAEEEADGN